MAQASQTATAKRVQTFSPKYSDTILFLVNGGQIWQKNAVEYGFPNWGTFRLFKGCIRLSIKIFFP